MYREKLFPGTQNKTVKTKGQKIDERLLRHGALRHLSPARADISHELRNPLAYITSTAQYLKTKLTDNTNLQPLLDGILRKVDKLSQTIDTLITLSTTCRLKREARPLQDTIKTVLKHFDSACKKKFVRIVDSLPEQPLNVLLDHEKLSCVFTELISNALDAMSKGGELGITVEALNHRLNIHISDTGTGVPVRFKRKIFQPFFSTKNDATGLGLILCRHIVQLHGGKLRFKSPPDGKHRGTVFTIQLPRRFVLSPPQVGHGRIRSTLPARQAGMP